MLSAHDEATVAAQVAGQIEKVRWMSVRELPQARTGLD
jgi:hypothetical protein